MCSRCTTMPFVDDFLRVCSMRNILVIIIIFVNVKSFISRFVREICISFAVPAVEFNSCIVLCIIFMRESFELRCAFAVPSHSAFRLNIFCCCCCNLIVYATARLSHAEECTNRRLAGSLQHNQIGLLVRRLYMKCFLLVIYVVAR